jgi:hypothetical protein
MQSSFARVLSLPPVVDIIVSRLGLVCPPYGIIKKKEGEEEGGRRQEKGTRRG